MPASRRDPYLELLTGYRHVDPPTGMKNSGWDPDPDRRRFKIGKRVVSAGTKEVPDEVAEAVVLGFEVRLEIRNPETGLSLAVNKGALGRVGKDPVGLADLFESQFSVRITGVTVRVPALGQFTESLF